MYAVPRKHTQSSGECCQPQSVFVSKVRARQVGRRSFSKPKPKIFSPRNFKFQILKFDSNGSSLASNSLSNCTACLLILVVPYPKPFRGLSCRLALQCHRDDESHQPCRKLPRLSRSWGSPSDQILKTSCRPDLSVRSPLRQRSYLTLKHAAYE